jgi:hypothetical protein
VLLCAVHPSDEVRARVAAGFPRWAATAATATPDGLPSAPDDAAVVVFFDPARTAAADVLARFDRRPHLVSTSDLRVAAGELGADHALPLRRLDESTVHRLLVLLDLLPTLARTAT